MKVLKLQDKHEQYKFFSGLKIKVEETGVSALLALSDRATLM
jgi:hypothetical protein